MYYKRDEFFQLKIGKFLCRELLKIPNPGCESTFTKLNKIWDQITIGVLNRLKQIRKQKIV